MNTIRERVDIYEQRKELLKELLDSWNTQYGDITIYRVHQFQDKYKYYVKLYNGGWSENEELQSTLNQLLKEYIIIDIHPHIVFDFHMLNKWASEILEQYPQYIKKGNYQISWEIKESER